MGFVMRIGLGPVFIYEWLTTSRRWQMYALRGLFVAILLGALAVVWLSELDDGPQPSRKRLAQVGEHFFYAIIGTQLALVLLAAPAATAGSICLDKARGVLAHLLITDLSDAEIVLGKLAARLLPVFGLLVAAMPVLFMGILLGGIEPMALLGAFLVTLGVAVFGCMLAFTLSVWGTKTHEVLLATYGIWILILLANPVWYFLAWLWQFGPPPDWFKMINPFWLALAPYSVPNSTDLMEPAVYLGISVALSVVLAALVICRIRAVTIRQSSRPQQLRKGIFFTFDLRKLTAWLPGPSLDGNPVLWREWRRKRPSLWARVIWSIYSVLAIVCCVVVINLDANQARGFGAFATALMVSVGMLLLSVSAVTVLAEERIRGSLDVLLATPISTAKIVWGKWWGTYRRVPWLVVLPAIIAFKIAFLKGELSGVIVLVALVLAYATAITSLGLALATWISRFGRAIGICVGIYVMVAVAWPISVMILGPRSYGHRWAEGLALASPFFGPGQITAEIEYRYRPDDFDLFAWGWGWIGFYVLAAICLYLATLGSFNKSMGRITKNRPGRERTRSTLATAS
jgi:ABC-type transport system involved in multi-copper enzyme maturation permease subunit